MLVCLGTTRQSDEVKIWFLSQLEEIDDVLSC